MPFPTSASRAASQCFEVFCIESHPKAGEVFVRLLREEARGNLPDLDVDTDFEMRLSARLDGLAPAKRYYADQRKSDAILAEIKAAVLAGRSRESSITSMLMDLSSRRALAELDRLSLLVRALSDGEVFDRITPGRPGETGATLPASEKLAKAPKPPKPPKAAVAPVAAVSAGPGDEKHMASAPDATGFGTITEKAGRDSIDFRITPLSSQRKAGGTKTAPPDPEMADRDALYAAANLAIARDGGFKLKKNAIAALKALHEGHALYRDDRTGLFHVQMLSATVRGGKVIEICMEGESKRYDKACSEDHWEDVDPDWIADDYREAYLTPFGLRKAIELFGPIYTPVIVHDPAVDDSEGDDGVYVNPQARIVYPVDWAGPLLALPPMRISELPAEGASASEDD